MELDANNINITDQVLGQGSYGIVYLGDYCKMDVAVKKLLESPKNLLQELSLLQCEINP